METRTPHITKIVVPLVFALVCVVGMMFGFRVFGGSLPLEPKGYRVGIPVQDASNLVRGSDVQVAGVDVGRVVGVRADRDGALAVVELDHRYAPLRRGARAIPRTKSLLGEAYLQLALGSRDAPRIPDGGRMHRSQVSDSIQLDEFLDAFGPRTRHRFRELFAGLAGAYGNRGEQLSGVIGNGARFTADLASVTAALDDQRDDLGRLVAGSAEILVTIGSRRGELRAAVRAGNEVLATTAKRHRELGATVRALAPFLRQLRATSDTVTAASGDIERAVSALLPVAPNVRPALAEISAAAPEFRGVLKRLPRTLKAADKGLPALRKMLPSVRRGLREFYPTSRELIPITKLLAVNKETPPSVMANLASITNGSYVGGDGTVFHYGRAVATAWNELIAGWKRKLPSSRPFPYPKPGALSDLARNGFLRSYDCRHTKNPMYLPPTGGATPCVVQGPWEFEGRSAYYPRLLLDRP